MESQVELNQNRKYRVKKHKLTLYLEEYYYDMLLELKKWYPQLSKNDLIRIAITKLFFAVKAAREGRDPCEDFLIM